MQTSAALQKLVGEAIFQQSSLTKISVGSNCLTGFSRLARLTHKSRIIAHPELKVNIVMRCHASCCQSCKCREVFYLTRQCIGRDFSMQFFWEVSMQLDWPVRVYRFLKSSMHFIIGLYAHAACVVILACPSRSEMANRSLQHTRRHLPSGMDFGQKICWK
jgi:hypothetical protein